MTDKPLVESGVDGGRRGAPDLGVGMSAVPKPGARRLFGDVGAIDDQPLRDPHLQRSTDDRAGRAGPAGSAAALQHEGLHQGSPLVGDVVGQ